jgi:hypothetical protein
MNREVTTTVEALLMAFGAFKGPLKCQSSQSIAVSSASPKGRKLAKGRERADQPRRSCVLGEREEEASVMRAYIPGTAGRQVLRDQ